MEQQIAERAKQHALSMYPDMRDEELQSFSDCRRDYAHGAREQYKIDYWKARKAFCKATCLGREKCPLLPKEDIECGGGLAIDCTKLEIFVKQWRNKI